MKAILFALLAVSSFSVSAHALQSHYGHLSSYGFEYTCSLANHGEHTIDMKYVSFTVEDMSGSNHPYDLDERIDQYVRPGETVSSTMTITKPVIVRYCKFLAR